MRARLLALPVLLLAMSAAAGEDEAVRTELLGNGATLIVQHRPGCATFAIHLSAAGGRLADPEGQLDLTEILAPMLLRGSLTRTGVQQALEVERLGSTIRPIAARLATSIAAAGPARAFPEVLDIVLDAALHPRLDAGDLAKEVDLARQRLHRSLDDPSAALDRAALPLLFARHPLGRQPDPAHPPEGLHIEALRRAHTEHFVGRRLVLVVTGDVRWEEVLRRAAGALAQVPAGEPPSLTLPAPVPLTRETRDRVRRRTPQPELLVAFPTAGVAEAEEPAMDLLSHILGGFGERLSEEIREERGWAYWVEVIDWRYPGAGLFGVRTAVPGNRLKEAELIIRSEIGRIAREPPSDEEVERARRYLNTTLARSWQISAARAETFASAVSRGRPPLTFEEASKRYASVTPRAITDLAHRLSAASAPAIVTLR